MTQTIKDRLPDLNTVLPVYATLIFVLYGWMTISFFWKVPAWLFYLNLGEVGVVYSYGVVNEFVESLIYIFILIALSVALPASFLKDKFQARGVLIVILILGVVYLTSYLIAFQEVNRLKAALFSLVVFGALSMLLFWMSMKFSFVEKSLIFMTDQLKIFLYVYAPITVISTFVVLFRMIG